MKASPRSILTGAMLALLAALGTGYSPSPEQSGMLVSVAFLAGAIPRLFPKLLPVR